MDEKNIIKFKQNRVRSEPTVHKEARLTYVLIRNRFDPKDILEPNAKILGYVIEGKYCNIYYNRSTRDIEIRIPRGVVGVDDRYINITRKISRVIDRAVRNEISRIEFLELLRSRSQD